MSTRNRPAAFRSPATVVRRQLQALARHDLDAVVAAYAEDAVLEAPGQAVLRGRAAIRRAYERFFAEWDEEIRIERLHVSGERVTAAGVATGRHRAPRLVIAGRIPVPLHAYRHTFVAVWIVDDGKITRHQVAYDAGDLVRQLLGS